ncbi:hypothetical protein BGZ60DRAFT_143341 [Tricladium varicosporioides]|nr:hypothetical protein BGZ60DRAFT_143341 [Hymenoscyphus varicosporioides]
MLQLTTRSIWTLFSSKIKLISPSSESRTAAITPAIAVASTAVIATYSQNPLVSESKTKEQKICGRCPKTMKDTPALKRHCSEVHKQDIDGNPISVQLFPCHITTCRKHIEPFKRREKRAQHIRTFHAEIIEGQQVNGGILYGERDAALTTNNTAEAGNDFGGNHGAARVSERAHHDSAEVSVWFEELLSQPIEVQSAPVAKACEMVLSYVHSQVL